jgi:iron(III) transport system ATP-binding protein
MTSLQISSLYKSYRTQAVLRGLDLEVPDGSFTSILGPSGSGKTTLLRVIAGFERADSGSVRIGESIVDDGDHYVMPDKRHIGYVPQEGSLFPHMTVRKNVAFGMARQERTRDRVHELLEMVGLGGMGRRYPHQLSGGQQQRVALARALAISPSLVLLDEPFSSLDASLRQSVRHDVREVLQAAGTTVILVTHDQDEALSLSDRVAVIHDGVIGQSDTPKNLYTHPASPHLAAEFGETNFLHGTAHGEVVDTPLGTLLLDAPLAGVPARSETPVLVLVRPEQLTVTTSNGSGATAVVCDSEFYGHDAVVRLRGSWDDSPVLVARCADAGAVPEVGATVAVEVRGAVTAWPADDDTSDPAPQ